MQRRFDAEMRGSSAQTPKLQSRIGDPDGWRKHIVELAKVVGRYRIYGVLGAILVTGSYISYERRFYEKNVADLERQVRSSREQYEDKIDSLKTKIETLNEEIAERDHEIVSLKDFNSSMEEQRRLFIASVELEVRLYERKFRHPPLPRLIVPAN